MRQELYFYKTDSGDEGQPAVGPDTYRKAQKEDSRYYYRRYQKSHSAPPKKFSVLSFYIVAAVGLTEHLGGREL